MNQQDPASVVLVDDDASVCIAMARLFRSANIALETFNSADAFLAADRIARTDCLIADVHMPGMSGFELLDFCRRRYPDLPVVMITAFQDDAAERRAIEAGSTAFFFKPVDGDALIETVYSAIQSRRIS